MDLPDKIKLGYRDIAIVKVITDFEHPSDNTGSFDDRRNTIFIQEKLDRYEEINTLLHELSHGILINAGLCQKGQILEDENHAELITNTIGNGFATVFRDNKPLLMLIYASLHEFEEDNSIRSEKAERK